MFDGISVTGITPLEYYPNKCCIDYAKQNIKSINLCLPCKKPLIESVNEVKISCCINDYKLLNTILGPKIVINLTTKIKAIYTAKNVEQSLHSEEWNINFCDFILLEELCYDKCCLYSPNLFVGLENVCVLKCDEDSIQICLLYIILSSIDKKNNCCNNSSDKCFDKKRNNKKNILNDTQKSNCNSYYKSINHNRYDE